MKSHLPETLYTELSLAMTTQGSPLSGTQQIILRNALPVALDIANARSSSQRGEDAVKIFRSKANSSAFDILPPLGYESHEAIGIESFEQAVRAAQEIAVCLLSSEDCTYYTVPILDLSHSGHPEAANLVERANFEAHVQFRYPELCLVRDKHGDYINSQVQSMREVWEVSRKTAP